MERWLPTDVAGYEVSDLGRVRSIDREMIGTYKRWGLASNHKFKSRVLKEAIAGKGYRQVALGAGRDRRRYVHRLVAAAFCVRGSESQEVNHKNGIKTDNRAENLEWVTKQQNGLHSAHVLGNTRGHFQPKLNPEQRAEALQAMADGIEVKEIARRFMVSPVTIYRCRRTCLG